MMTEGLDSVDVLHPLLGVRPPDLATLIDRADGRAHRVLHAMRRLHRRRIAQQRDLEARVDALSRGDGFGDAPRFHPGPALVVESDLLRALIALEPERIAAPFGDTLLTEDFTALVDRCTQMLEDAPQPGEDDALDPAWALRWALSDERHGATAVTVSLLLASLGTDGLCDVASLSEQYVEGLITVQEFGSAWFRDAEHEVSSRAFGAVPPAYLDRGEGLAALEEAFASSGRVLLCGSPRSGRSALLRAWLEPGGHDRPVVIDPHVECFDREPATITSPTLVGLVAPRMGARRAENLLVSYGLVFDEAELVARRRTWLARNAESLQADGSLRLVMVMDPAETSAMREVLPCFGDFEQVHVAEPDPLHRAMIWLAHTMPDPSLGLAHVLSAVHFLGLDRMAAIDPWALDDLVEPKRLRGAFDLDAARQSMSHRMIRRSLEAYDRGQSKRSGMMRRIVRRLGGENGFEALVALDERLYGPRSSR